MMTCVVGGPRVAMCGHTERGLWDLADLSDQTVCVASRPNTKPGLCIHSSCLYLVIYLSLMYVYSLYTRFGAQKAGVMLQLSQRF